ncbi:MAG TPA: hypothetical protein VF688_10290 [Allosphingosinicella sp.]|jgi:hypothetical protein
MSEDEGGLAAGEGGDPPRAEGDSDRGGISGDSAVQGGAPSPARSGEVPDDDQAPIDLDAVRDRAS